MKKLTLDIDELRVESFETIGARRGAGTVLAHDDATPANTCECYSEACPTAPAAGTCGGCVYSIDGAGAYCTYDCGTGGNTIGEHCGPQGTMNPMWSECMINTMAGATCEGDTCGRLCSYIDC
ncbi:MAG TPA: hypothetical protein VFR81_09230 [Longimicrobium sp.]|nr:hypothetical protein [Longimicrobium sp.]